MSVGGPFRAFRRPAFRSLWFTATSYHLAYWILYTGLQLVIADITDHNPVMLGVLQFSLLIPYLVLSPTSGVLADRMDRKRILRIAHATGFTAFTATLVLALTGTLGVWQAVLVGLLTGATSTLISSSTNSMVPSTVPRADLTSAAPLQTATSNIGRMAGPALVGPLIWLGGNTLMFATVVVMMLASIVAAIWLPRTQPAHAGGESIRRSIAAGVEHARQRPPAVALLIAVAVTSMIGAGFQAQQTVIAAHVSPARADELFLVMATLGGVASLVAIALTTLQRRTPTLLRTAIVMLLQGVFVIGIGFANTPWMALVCVAGAQALVIMVMTLAGSALQHIVDDAYRGRVLSLYFMAWGGIMPFGGLGLGVLIRSTSVPVALWIFGLLVAVVALGLIAHSRRADAR